MAGRKDARVKDRSIEDLIGGEPEEANEPFSMAAEDTYRGVTITWLMRAFRRDRSTIQRLLSGLDPIRYDRGNIPMYDFVQAANCIATPKVDVAEYMRKLEPADLPPELQIEYWDARLKRQKFMRQAGELWHTEDVIERFGEAFKHIKTSTQLWVNSLERVTGLTPEQYTLVRSLTDDLLKDINERLSEMKASSRTPSTAEDEDLPSLEDDDASV